MEQHRSSSDAMLSSVCLYVIWSTNFYVSASDFYVSASDFYVSAYDFYVSAYDLFVKQHVEGFCDDRNDSACLSATNHRTKRKKKDYFPLPEVSTHGFLTSAIIANFPASHIEYCE